MASQGNSMATAFKALHQRGDPLILANIWDTLSARTVAALPSCKALATSSAAVARVNGTQDNDMSLETSLKAVRDISAVAKEFNKPLTVDIQDAFGSRLEEAIKTLIELGVSGANIEDCDKDTGSMIAVSTAASRIERALTTAKEYGVPDFVVNARCDTLAHNGTFEDALERGKAYLAAGATCVFVISGPQRKIARAEIAEMVKAFDGRVNVGWNPASGLSIKDVVELGVTRVSVGPFMQVLALRSLASEAEKLMSGTA